MGKHGLGTYEVRAHVDRPAAVELRDGGVADRTVADLDADVGPRGIDGAEGLHHLREAVRKRRRVTGVDSDRDRIGLGCDLGERVGCDIEERQVPPGRVQLASAPAAPIPVAAPTITMRLWLEAGGSTLIGLALLGDPEASLPQACAVDTRPVTALGLTLAAIPGR